MTWIVAGKKHFDAVRFQIKFAMFAGLLYAGVDTLPVLFLKFDLPYASCESEDCTGTSFACALNRTRLYILLSIMINMAGLVYGLYQTVAKGDYDVKREQTVDRLCVVVPVVLLVVAFAMEGSENMDEDIENGLLNVTRHSFKCSMRFATVIEEWIFLWVHFLWSGIMIVGYSAAAYLKVNSIQKGLNLDPTKTFGRNMVRKIGVQKRRLFKVAHHFQCCSTSCG